MRLNQAKKDAGERAKVLEVGCPPRSPTAVPGFLSPTLGWKEEDATKARIFLVQECTVEHIRCRRWKTCVDGTSWTGARDVDGFEPTNQDAGQLAKVS